MTMVVPQQHKVFVSFDHEDVEYKKHFCRKLGTDIVDKSVAHGDIDTGLKTATIRQKIRDEFIAEASVTVVLVGRCTWQRKHVDWEIGSSLKNTKTNARCGLVGILLPTHLDYGRKTGRKALIPPRLADNCGCDKSFGSIHSWPKPWNTDTIRRWIQYAFERRKNFLPDNSRQPFAKNRTGPCNIGWSN